MERGTVLFVSHDAGAVSSLCQRAVWLERGHVQMIGTPKTVTAQYHAAMYEAQQGAGARGDGSAAATQLASQAPRDARQDFINASNLRNDLQVFSFDPGGPAFGKGGARIVGVELTATDGTPLAWVVGGEDVSLVIRAAVDSALSRPIVGFFVKDRLGQALFGDNTFLSYLDAPIPARPGDVLEARFAFRMPVLPVGEYSICVAVADGTQHDHVQHHWLHDAVILRSHSSSLATGLVGVPMREIELCVATSTADGRSVT
jgi:lipopolysaccharide transport system ATP-binding protein